MDSVRGSYRSMVTIDRAQKIRYTSDLEVDVSFKNMCNLLMDNYQYNGMRIPITGLVQSERYPCILDWPIQVS